MATTNRSRSRQSRRTQRWLVGRALVGRRVRVAALVATAGLTLSTVSRPVSAELWRLDPGISSQLAWTSNTQLGSAVGQEDFGLEVRPRISIRGEGARLRLDGSGSLRAVTYANGTQPNRTLPEGDFSARLEAIERLLFVETGARALQSSENPFGANPALTSTANTVTSAQGRLSVYMDTGPTSEYRFVARTDNVYTKTNGAAFALTTTAARSVFNRHSVSLEREPRPLGFRVEALRGRTRYLDDVTEPIDVDLARVSLFYLLEHDLRVGIRGGAERDSFVTGDDRRRAIYGVEARWRPTERTSIDGFVEERIFGRGWRLAFDHRTPLVAWTALLNRDIGTTPQSLFDLPATNNVAALLDAIFTTRFPDPAERARQVQDFIAQQGLPSALVKPTTLVSQRLSIVNSASASLTLIGSRNSLAISVFQARTKDALDSGLLVTGSAITNNVDQRVGFVLSHRLTPTSSLSASLEWSRIRALDGIGSDETKQGTARLQVSTRVAPRTSFVYGVQYRKLASNVAVSGEEAVALVGIDHGF